MMSYEEFKREVLASFLLYLPKKYEGHQIKMNKVPQVNEVAETISIVLPGEIGATPNLYLQQMYQQYRECGSIEKILKDAAKKFIYSMEYINKTVDHLGYGRSRENIVMNLINTEKNDHVLDYCPSRSIMDLSIVYRWIMTLEDGTFNGSLISQDMAADFGMTEEDLYHMATQNTKRILRPIVEKIDDAVYLLSNHYRIHGAVTMLYDGILANIAEEWDEDLFVLPASIHEAIVVPVPTQTIHRLEALIKEANGSVVNNMDILSDHVYYYDRKKDGLILATK